MQFATNVGIQREKGCLAIKHAKTFDDLPTPRHTAVMDEIEKEGQTDRAVAIIGAAYMDLVLRQAITARLLPDDKLLNDLFENRGPLQEFGSRIQIALALNVCGRAAHHDLRKIKEIRNAFAHSAEAIDFQNQGVALLCQALWYPKRIHYAKHPDPKTPRLQYVRAISLLTELFLEDLRRQQHGITREFLIMAPGPFDPAAVKK